MQDSPPLNLFKMLVFSNINSVPAFVRSKNLSCFLKFCDEAVLPNYVGRATLFKESSVSGNRHQWKEVLVHVVLNIKMTGESRSRKLIFVPGPRDLLPVQ